MAWLRLRSGKLRRTPSMFDLRKLFVRDPGARRGGDPDSDYHPSGRQGEGLEVEYQSLIATQFRRWGISPECVTIEVRQIGRAPDGFEVFVGMVRLHRWERISGLRVLLGLPLLEAKVRKMVRGTWMGDFSHFAGLWLHASEQLSGSNAHSELRELMLQLVPPSPRSSGQAGAAQGEFGASSMAVPSAMTTRAPASSRAPLSGTSEGASLGDDEPVAG